MRIQSLRLASIALLAPCLLLTSLDSSAEEKKRIEDNSFLIEEAYNQEDGVFQYIQSYEYSKKTNEWLYTFTHEMPLPNLYHQFSYTVPIALPSYRKVPRRLGQWCNGLPSQYSAQR